MSKVNTSPRANRTATPAPRSTKFEPWMPAPPDASAPSALIRLCARRALTAAQTADLVALGRALEPSGWAQVVTIAVVNGVVPLVYWHTARAGLIELQPPQVASELLAGYREALVTSRSLRLARDRVLEALDAAAIEAISLKGVTLGDRLYGDPALRPTNDVDILVRRRDLARANGVIRTLGYRPLPGADSPQRFGALVLATLPFDAPNGATRLEVHWELPHHPAYRRGLDVGAVFARARVEQSAGRPVLCLDPADELRYLAVHCTADHGVGRLIWLVDIAELVRAQGPDWSWPDFVGGTIAGGLAAPVVVALAHCQTQLDLRLPPDVIPSLVVAAQGRSEARNFATNRADYYGPVGARLHLAAVGGPVSRALLLGYLLLPHPWTLRQLYGGRHFRLKLPWTYARHISRVMWYMAQPGSHS